MKRNITRYLLAAALTVASVNPAQAMETTPPINPINASTAALAIFSVCSGITLGIVLGNKASELGDETGKFFNDKLGLSKKQNLLKKLAAIITHTGINLATLVPVMTAHNALSIMIMPIESAKNYPILTAGLFSGNVFFDLSLIVSSVIKSIRYGLTAPDTSQDDSSDPAFVN